MSQREHVDYLLNGVVITMDDSNRIIREGCVAVDKGRILAVGNKTVINDIIKFMRIAFIRHTQANGIPLVNLDEAVVLAEARQLSDRLRPVLEARRYRPLTQYATVC